MERFRVGCVVIVGTSWCSPFVSIPINIGGIGQLVSEVVCCDVIQKYKVVRAQIESLSPEVSPDVVIALKEKQKIHLMTHIGCMLALFVHSCHNSTYGNRRPASSPHRHRGSLRSQLLL